MILLVHSSFEQMVGFLLLGSLSSGVLLLCFLYAQHLYYTGKQKSYFEDGAAPKYYITGDKHRRFRKIQAFCRYNNTRRKDIIIVLGDAGFNYFEDRRDDKLKSKIQKLPITLFCLHGNKEKRPQTVGTYGVRSFCGGLVYYEPKYPNIYFAIDGEVYTIEGKTYMVIGGAHSVDKQQCLRKRYPFWEDEMPDEDTKQKVEARLFEENYRLFGFLTHTCPVEYLPTEMFISTRQNSAKKRKILKRKKMFVPDIDRSTEVWLGELEKKTAYTVWFCGHYHIDKQLDKVIMLHDEIRPLHMGAEGT